MFSIIWSREKKGSFLGSSSSSSSCKGSDDEGLRLILTKQLANENSDNINVVVKKPINIFLMIKPKPKPDHHHQLSYNCYLKSCHLCYKPLNLDKEIYMYRGDLGFCSVECRDRQIDVDETKEIQVSTQRILSSFRQRDGGGGRCQRRHPFSSHEKDRVIFL